MSDYFDASVSRVTDGLTARASDVNTLRDAVGSAFDLLPDKAKVNAGKVTFAVDTSVSANTYLVALPETAASYVDGLQVVMRPIRTNTGAATINVDSLGAKSIRGVNSEVLSAGDIVIGVPIDLRYSTVTGFFHISQPAYAAASAAAAAASASAASASAAAAVVATDAVFQQATLTDGATITCDISLGTCFDVTLGGDRTINFSGGTADLDGKKFVIRLKQDGTGSRLVTWGTGARFGTDIPFITLTTTASKIDHVGLIYDHTAGKCDIVAFVKGY